MRFAVSLVRLLCAIIAGAVLVAFLYFIGQGAEYRTVTMVSMVLFIAALLIWALVAAIGDGWLRKVSDNNFYQKISGKPDNKALEAFITASVDQITNKVSQNDEAKHKLLLNEFQTLSEKIGALSVSAPEERTAIVENSEELRVITENMQKLEMQISELHNAVKAQIKTIDAMLQSSGQWETSPRVYPQLTEEAAYPESVIDYSQKEDSPEQSIPVSEEASATTEEQIDEPIVEEVVDSGEDEQIVIDEPLDSFLAENDTLEAEKNDSKNEEESFEMPSDIVSVEDIELPKTEAKVDLSADDPFGVSMELTPSGDVDIVTAEEADAALDLGADDPFGVSAEVLPDAHIESVFEPEHHTIDLGADNPFGTSVDVASPIDVSAIEPAANVKKNEPNLDHIFNDELASELADLEILNDKKDDDKDDLDLEQFFAGHRKSLG